jgi:hypothetical protein
MLWELGKDRSIAPWNAGKTYGAAVALAVSRDGTCVLVGRPYQVLQLYDINTRKVIAELKVPVRIPDNAERQESRD